MMCLFPVLWRLTLQLTNTMFVPEKFKLNKFKDVALPSVRSYFARYGYNSQPAGSFSGEDEVAPMRGNKVDMLADMEAYDRMKQREEDSKG